MAPKRKAKRPVDDNRHRRMKIIEELDRLMTEQLDPAFTGNVEVLVPAKDGRIGEPKFTVTRYGFAPK